MKLVSYGVNRKIGIDNVMCRSSIHLTVQFWSRTTGRVLQARTVCGKICVDSSDTKGAEEKLT